MPHQAVVPVDEGPTRSRENVDSIRDVVWKPPANPVSFACHIVAVNHSTSIHTTTVSSFSSIIIRSQAQRRWATAPTVRNHTHIPHLHPHPKQTRAQTRVQIPQLVDTIPTLPRLAYVLPAWIRAPALHPHEAHPTRNGPASAAGGLESLGSCLRMPSFTALLISTSTSRLLQLAIRSTPAPCACSTRNPRI